VSSPSVDLDYDLTDDLVPGPWQRDSVFLFWRSERAVQQAADGVHRGRLLDVACGTADQAGRFQKQGWQSWGLEPSPGMLRLARLRREQRGQSVVLVRGIAEQLPFSDDSFDCVLCQGSLDHFARPRAFMGEVVRILKPDGQAIIALANYESLSCRLGRSLYRAKQLLGIPVMGGRAYWQIPPNHTFKGDLTVLRGMAHPWLRLERCHGVSVLWLFRRWSLFVESLPEDVAWALLRTLDQIAYRVPALSDMIISVWRPNKAALAR
jgi:SAM-dependent methyltransferase